jgi:hypothetical protein
VLVHSNMQPATVRLFYLSIICVKMCCQLSEDVPACAATYRYKLMTAYMPTVGSMGLDMMYRTCTVQVGGSIQAFQRQRGCKTATCYSS